MFYMKWWTGGIVRFKMSNFNVLTLKLQFGYLFWCERGSAVDCKNEEKAVVLSPKR